VAEGIGPEFIPQYHKKKKIDLIQGKVPLESACPA
jgi:hypothetical protein